MNLNKVRRKTNEKQKQKPTLSFQNFKSFFVLRAGQHSQGDH